MLLKIYPENPNPREIARVVEVLRGGGIIIYPTDTVYGMGCDIFNARAVETICRLKNINPRKANLSFICHDLSNISEYARVSNATFKLMKRNLPGAFTFILQGNNHLPKLFKEKQTVGIRVPDNNIARSIVRELGHPILSTSVKDGEDEIQAHFSDPELIYERYGNLADIVIDGGNCALETSTIVDCTSDEFVITRQGKGELIY
ncbi:MAG: threonylcarbamoyl-AMP synthase [Prevotellaceae bacterium]|jgi:tRNA threonylcarbamoyl adenosine modification protein (Sua5/YciO/YrdC/YwlC family)|nr:threonylcarbamoyl-AMP synthase [Prevotellaceae bacterium]